MPMVNICFSIYQCESYPSLSGMYNLLRIEDKKSKKSVIMDRNS